MLAFADRREPRDARAELHRCRGDLSLIELGIAEAAIADALCPDRDEPLPPLVVLREAMDALARGDRRAAGAALDRVGDDRIPARIHVAVPEGFAFYGLSPETYKNVAAAWAERVRPVHVVCLGLRSIGTTLASAAAAGLAERGVPVTTWTLRPRGHPFDRQLVLAASLTSTWPLDRATFLIVDEGPGLSGSSFAGAADALTARGVPDERIVFLAAWNPEASQLRSSRARDRWTRHQVLIAAAAPVPDGAIDLSGGLWRAHLALGDWPAAHPHHERIKYLEGDRISRFAGLGAWGRDASARAARLADAGWTTAPLVLANGFLTQPFAAGLPATDADSQADLVARGADYVAWLRAHESGSVAADVAPVCEMLRVNAREGLGEAVLPAVETLSADAAAFAEPATAIDGRLLPHEWLRTATGLIKVDALDHHRDHFLPGVADAAWDVAGLLVEMRVPRQHRDAVVERYRRASSDLTIARRLPFYLAAYTAFRLGYTTLALEAVQGDEEARFACARERYASELAQAIKADALPSAP